MATMPFTAFCLELLSSNSFQMQMYLFFMRYQIKLCTFVAEILFKGMNRIKEVLESKGISQTELANLLGKSFNMVNLYATNKVQPPISILYQIADILNIDVRDLLVPNEIKK